jgi:PKD repeat protein
MTPSRVPLALVLVMVAVLLVAGCAGQLGLDNRMNSVKPINQELKNPVQKLIRMTPIQSIAPLIYINNFTENVAVGVRSRDDLNSVKSLEGQEYILPTCLKKFDIINLRTVEFRKKITENASVNMEIYGKPYRASIIRLKPGDANYQTNSFRGSLQGEPNNYISLTFFDDKVMGAIWFRNETLFFAPFEIEGNTVSNSSVLYMIFSSRDVEDPQSCANISAALMATQSSRSTLIADFSPTSTVGTIPFTIRFIDNSSGSPTSWHWDFDDGSFSDESSPIHTYNNIPNVSEPDIVKHVTLTVRNRTASDSKSFDILIHSPYPFPDFNVTPLNPRAYMFVHFTDTSRGAPGLAHWDFGDGSGSNTRNPEHMYSHSGTYRVELTESNPLYSRSKNVTIFVMSGFQSLPAE